MNFLTGMNSFRDTVLKSLRHSIYVLMIAVPYCFKNLALNLEAFPQPPFYVNTG